ncbi:MAG: glycoside hydrolase family 28 protein [Lachnospiraceae bacterium]
MELKLLLVTPRSVCFEISGTGKYHTDCRYRVYVNGHLVETEELVIRSIYHLLPDRKYTITVIREDELAGGFLTFTTEKESVTLNVKDFGAKGDGESDDTHQIQAAIMNCPKKGRVLIPEGCFLIKSLFLRSDMQLELEKGAELRAIPVREGRGIQPGVLPSTDGRDEYHFGTWEGNPEPMFSGILSGIEVQNVYIYGEGVLNGGAAKENWWKNHRKMNMAYRPRLFFVRNCKGIYLQGITLKNSPAWTMHPFFSENLGFYNLSVENPSDSPNTDGLDPESCKNIEIAGVRFSLGDDCIAVKSGKIYMGRKYKKPSEDICIHNCLMQDGHGAVTVGSEMAGGVKNLTVKDCMFSHTDRGLRVKTRRGRGKDAVLDRISFKNIEMDHVMTPFVVNSFYFCDPDGKTSYVQSREMLLKDDRTPVIERLEFTDIKAMNCHVAAAYIEGLPEAKVGELVMKNISVSYAENAKCDVPAMSVGVEPCSKKGVFVRNVKKVVMEHVEITGNEGETFTIEEVDEITRV